MLPAIHIKRTIDFNKGFRSLLEVLKLVAVSEYHSLERKLKSFERLQDLLGEFFGAVDLNSVRHPFVSPSDKPPAILAVTSDAGLLGGINMQVISKALELAREGGGKLIVMGERGLIYAQDMGLPFDHYPGIIDTRRFEQAAQMRDTLSKLVMSGEAGGIKVVFPKALSFVVHRVEVTTLVPFTNNAAVPDAAADPRNRMIMESTPEAVVEYLVYLIIGQRLFEIFGMSRVCEQAARFVHLEESCNKISDMNKKLLLQYFRRRHEIIDANMRELFSARNIYAK